MILNRSSLVSIFCLLLFTSFNSAAEKLNLYTEELAPYNYTHHGEFLGISTEVVLAFLKEQQEGYSIVSYPWSRTYAEVQSDSNGLIFSISRLPERESTFHWLGVIVPSYHGVFALKKRADIIVESPSDLNNYKVTTMSGGAIETLLLSQNVTKERLVRLTGNDVLKRQYNMLKAGRIDLWATTQASASYIPRLEGDHPKDVLREVYRFNPLSKGYFLAASKKMPQKKADELKRKLQLFLKSNTYRGILNKWGMSVPSE